MTYTAEAGDDVAGDDVAGAYAWCEKREPGLGEEFLRALAATVGTLQRHPQLYPVAVDEFRRALLRRLPLRGVL